MVAAWLDTLNVSGLDEALECRGVGFFVGILQLVEILIECQLCKSREIHHGGKFGSNSATHLGRVCGAGENRLYRLMVLRDELLCILGGCRCALRNDHHHDEERDCAQTKNFMKRCD